jgi:uncharacterized protein (TIGR02246 family)
MSFEGPIEDRLAIRELVDAYGDAVCQRDADAWVATWAPDGVWLLRGKTISGHADLRAAWLSAMAAYQFVSFAGRPGAIRVVGDTAMLRVQTSEWLVPVAGRPRCQVGTYEDRLVKIQGAWLFAQRSFTVQLLHGV